MFLFQSLIVLSGVSTSPESIILAKASNHKRTTPVHCGVGHDSFKVQHKNSGLAFIPQYSFTNQKKKKEQYVEHALSTKKKVSVQSQKKVFSSAKSTFESKPEAESESQNKPKQEFTKERKYRLAYQRLEPFGELLAKQAKNQFADSLAQIKEIFTQHGQVKGRPKSAHSITEKLARKSIEQGLVYPDLETAKGTINDAIGTRLIMWNGNMADMDNVVVSLSNAIRNGKIQVIEVSNFFGKSGIPYLVNNHIDALMNVIVSDPKKAKVQHISIKPEVYKASGYTTTQMDIFHRNGALGELQVRGPQVDRFAEIEHVIYDIRQGKSFKNNLPPILKQQFEEIQNTLLSLSKEEMACYLAYIQSTYRYFRLLENEIIPIAEPQLPKPIERYPYLNFHHIERLCNQAFDNSNCTRNRLLFSSLSGDTKNTGKYFRHRDVRHADSGGK